MPLSAIFNKISMRALPYSISLKILAWLSVFLLPTLGVAQTRNDELKRCLGDFDGIVWKLPYQPPMHIRSCASPGNNYDTSDTSPNGLRTLELIGELTLPDATHLSSDDTYAALQNATYVHFDALFRRHGYTLSAVEHGDARTHYNPDTMRLLRDMPALPASESAQAEKRAAEEPPIPYINLARYVRNREGRQIRLTYTSEAKNTWKISIEGLPANTPAPASTIAPRNTP